MFIGRQKEMQKLERLARLGKASLVVCRGRRRIGKSTLIQQFAATQPSFYEFHGLAPRESMSNAHQLAHFSHTLAQYFALPPLTLKNWQEAFSLLANQLQDRNAVVLLDEVSWMGAQDRDFPGQLKIAWDTKLKHNDKLIMVLCGSVTSWVDRNILNSADFMGRVSLTITLDELALPHCAAFWRGRAARVSAHEKFKLLAVTGGVPRYLEEIDPADTAENNIKAMCFDTAGVLFSEFDNIFTDIFSRRAAQYRQLVQTLVEGPRSFSEICERITVSPNGVISGYLEDLRTSGLVARDHVYSPASGKRGKLSRYRLRDNYVRYYLKYIEPQKDKIEKGLYELVSLEDLPAAETIFGLQLENLVLNNLNGVAGALGIPHAAIVSAAPYFQNRTRRQRAVQVDLLIQTRNTLYVCEVKFRRSVGKAVIQEVQDKISRLKVPRQMSVRPVLIHVGKLTSGVRDADYFDRILSLGDLLAQR